MNDTLLTFGQYHRIVLQLTEMCVQKWFDK